MMTLKNLIVYTDVTANEFLKNWSYDPNTLKFWRGSSNYVYVFQFNGEKFFLRFSNEEDNSIEQITAELDFIEYLRDNHYPAIQPILSNNGKYIETVTTKRGLYFGVVFAGAKGVNLDISMMSEEQFKNWGKALGSLHALSNSYKPKKFVRKNWNDKLLFIEEILRDSPEEESVQEEIERVRDWLNNLPVSVNNFGLVHYDFELDNIFWAESERHFHVIDFDDSMYHWYIVDIAFALRDLDELDEAEANVSLKAFLDGYCSAYDVKEDIITLLPRFRRFINLFSYAKITRSLKDSDFVEEPDWLKKLRPKLYRWCDKLREGFKKPF